MSVFRVPGFETICCVLTPRFRRSVLFPVVLCLIKVTCRSRRRKKRESQPPLKAGLPLCSKMLSSFNGLKMNTCQFPEKPASNTQTHRESSHLKRKEKNSASFAKQRTCTCAREGIISFVLKFFSASLPVSSILILFKFKYWVYDFFFFVNYICMNAISYLCIKTGSPLKDKQIKPTLFLSFLCTESKALQSCSEL